MAVNGVLLLMPCTSSHHANGAKCMSQVTMWESSD